MGIKVYRAGAVKVKENIGLLKENRLYELTTQDSCGGHQGQCGHQ